MSRRAHLLTNPLAARELMDSEACVIPGISDADAARKLVELHRICQAVERDWRESFFRPLNGKAVRSRPGYLSAISTLVKFLEFMDFSGPVVLEWLELGVGLAELDRGSVREFLASPEPGRAIDPGDTWFIRCYVSMAVDVLIHSGMSRPAAAAHIAKSHPFLGMFTNTKKNNLAGTISRWQRQFASNEVKDYRAQSSYNNRAELFSLVIQSLEPVVSGDNVAKSVTSYLLREATFQASRMVAGSQIRNSRMRNEECS